MMRHRSMLLLMLGAGTAGAQQLPPIRQLGPVVAKSDAAWANIASVRALPGGRVLVLEFSKPWKPLARAYDAYSFNVLPLLGKYVAKDEAAYRYLAESIRMHPDQEQIKQMMEQAGFEQVEYFNLAAGVVALHRGYKI